MGRPAIGSSSPDALNLAPGLEPWKQQPGETAEAFHRFLQYLDVDPLVRSKNRMQVVYELLLVRDPHMCSVSALQNMATLNHWHTRAAAHDEYRRQQAEIAAARAQQDWAETIERRRAEICLKHLDIADEIIQKGLRALAMRDSDSLTDAVALKMITDGVKIEKDTLGLSRPRGTASPPEHVDQMDDETATARLRELADELASRINNPPGSPAHTYTTAAAAPDVIDAEVIPQGSSDDPSVEPGTGELEPWEYPADPA